MTKRRGDEKASKPDRVLRFSPSLADDGHEGYMIRSPYAEVAHFLVVRHMLQRFKRVYFYMDASYDLTQPVMVALHDWVESGRAHVAVFQHEKTGKREQEKDRAPRGTREEALPKAIAQAETRFARCAEEKLELGAKTADLLGDDTRVRRARAAAWQLAPQGAQSKDGAFAWLHFPGNTSHYRNCRTLWLSRGPDDAPDDGHDLLIGVTLQSVDSACNAMRSGGQHDRTLRRWGERPELRAPALPRRAGHGRTAHISAHAKFRATPGEGLCARDHPCGHLGAVGRGGGRHGRRALAFPSRHRACP